MRGSKALLLASMGIVLATVVLRERAPAQTTTTSEPGGDAASAALAQSNPDEYAWRLFEFINLQAAPGKAGAPAAGKTILGYDPDTPTVWESWALASGDGHSQTGSEVFKPDGSIPVAWDSLPRTALAPKIFSANLTLAAKLGHDLKIHDGLPLTGPEKGGKNKILIGPNGATGFEVRMNEAAFTFVVRNQLFYTQGLAAQLTAARVSGNRDAITFPDAAKEVKAVWVPTTNPLQISADEKARYHWRFSSGKYYKLAGFHILTRDMKLWFWATFTQEDYETSGKDQKPLPTLPRSRDSTTRGPNAPDRGSTDGERRELTGSKWAHYRLRGTQITYVDAAGKPIILGNPVIEDGFADTASCMTCHFRATVGDPIGGGKNDFLDPEGTAVGTPIDGQLGQGNTIKYLQTDFIWSAPIRAQPRKAPKK